MRGRDAALHVRLLGLRADEPNRVHRVLSRSLFAEGATTSACAVRTQPAGERPYFPLHDSGFTKDDVIDYWERRPFDLEIPNGAGNCVFCFMKGTRQLATLAAAPDPRRRCGTPADSRWWIELEDRHARVELRRGGGATSRFGFFGVNAPSFADLLAGDGAAAGRYAQGAPACDCTD
ncbi:MAG: hypothetical protein OXH52_14535 [Gammaproteobacteria bacterium]|nr:hypothetical protein [Gammaproteobacteria bacterium]